MLMLNIYCGNIILLTMRLVSSAAPAYARSRIENMSDEGRFANIDVARKQSANCREIVNLFIATYLHIREIGANAGHESAKVAF